MAAASAIDGAREASAVSALGVPPPALLHPDRAVLREMTGQALVPKGYGNPRSAARSWPTPGRSPAILPRRESSGNPTASSSDPLNANNQVAQGGRITGVSAARRSVTRGLAGEPRMDKGNADAALAPRSMPRRRAHSRGPATGPRFGASLERHGFVARSSTRPSSAGSS